MIISGVLRRGFILSIFKYELVDEELVFLETVEIKRLINII